MNFSLSLQVSLKYRDEATKVHEEEPAVTAVKVNTVREHSPNINTGRKYNRGVKRVNCKVQGKCVCECFRYPEAQSHDRLCCLQGLTLRGYKTVHCL